MQFINFANFKSAKEGRLIEMKPSKVFLAPYDSWNNILKILSAVGLTLMILDWYFPSFWLTSIVVLDGIVETVCLIILLVLNGRKKKRLEREHRHID